MSTMFQFPATLASDIHEWVDENCHHRHFIGRDFVTLTDDIEAMHFKMRWNDEIATAELEVMGRGYTVGYGGLNITSGLIINLNPVVVAISNHIRKLTPPKKLHGPAHCRQRWER